MPVELPDFTNLPLTAIFSYLVIVAAVDVGFNIVLSFVHGDFSAIYVADFLRTHILLRVFPIGAAAILGHGVPALGVPAIPALSLAAAASQDSAGGRGLLQLADDVAPHRIRMTGPRHRR